VSSARGFDDGVTTGASYDGGRFARDGIVCVSINYRVGAEGFLYVADGTAKLSWSPRRRPAIRPRSTV
jgi:carboxylesterase type B